MSETVAFRGDQYSEWAGTAGAADNALIYTSGNVSEFNYHTISVTGTDAADVEVTVDGSTWNIVSTLLADDVTTGGGVKVITIPTGKLGILHGQFKQIRVRQDGATDADAFGSHGNI
jgi:hypothetical protein